MQARKKMKPGLVMAVCGLVLTFGDVTRAGEDGAGQDVNWADPNEASWFSVSWTSVSLSTTLYNPAENPTQAAEGVSRELAISGQIRVLDPNWVLGLSYTTADCRAIDEQGVEWATSSGMSWMRSYSSLPTRFPRGVGLSFPMDPNRGYPLLLKEVSWSTYALLFRAKQSVDTPFQVTGQWVQIVPGVKILMEEATSQDGTYRYQFKAEFDGKSNPFTPIAIIREGQALAENLITKIQLLDAKGTPVNDASTGGGVFSSSMSGSTGNATCSGSGRCSACGGVKTMRFAVAVNPYEVKIPFVLTDIPVPTF